MIQKVRLHIPAATFRIFTLLVISLSLVVVAHAQTESVLYNFGSYRMREHPFHDRSNLPKGGRSHRPLAQKCFGR